MNTNKTNITGKYACPFFSFIWFTTMLCTVEYTDSWDIDQLFDTILFWLAEIRLSINKRLPLSVKYSPMLVIDSDKLAKIGASKLNRFLISNWSNGLIWCVNVFM